MVPRQRSCNASLLIIGILLYDYGSWVSNIAHEQVAAIGEQTDACGATKPHVYAHIANLVICLLERTDQCRVHFA